MNVDEVNFYAAMAGTVAFALSAVLSVSDRKIDLFAAIVLGTMTAVGGGTIRDIIVDVPVFWGKELSYIWVSIVTCVFTFFTYKLFVRHHFMRSLFLYLDGFGAALFGIEAVGKVWDLGFGLPVGPVILGVTTAIGGGLIRDMLAGRQTLLMSRELYAVPVLFGCSLFVLILTYAPEYRFWGSIFCMLVIFVIRFAAIKWKLKIPEWNIIGGNL